MNGMPTEPRATSPCAVERCAKSGPKTSGPQIAPDDGPEEDERHAARAALRREHLGGRGARELDDRPGRADEREPEATRPPTTTRSRAR